MIMLILFVSGLIFGSFAGATVWRLHKQSVSKKNKAQYSIAKGRSVCEHCGHQLAAKDLVPLLSWILLHGKCRYCGHSLSIELPAIEFITGLLFVFSYIFWPYNLSGGPIAAFIAWLAVMVLFVMLTVYDLKWMLLPNQLVLAATVASIVLTLILVIAGEVHLLWAIVSGFGFFGLLWALFQVSAGRWIGGGDVKLVFALGLLAGTVPKALLILFTASIIGTIIITPLLVLKKLTPRTRIPFGPLLMLASVVVFLFGTAVIDWYMHKLLYV